MKSKKKLNFYSTNPNFKYDDELEETLSKEKQNLEVWIDKHRAGKTAVIIKGFIGNNDDLKSLKFVKKYKL